MIAVYESWQARDFHRRTSQGESFEGEFKDALFVGPDGSSLPETLPLYAGCVQPQEGRIRFRSKVIVHRDFVRFFDLERHPERAIDKQLAFLDGYFHFATRGESSSWTSPQGPPKILSQQIRWVRYGKTLSYDPVDQNPSLYPSSFLHEKVISPTDPALEIDYEAERGVVVCGLVLRKEAPSNVALTLPYDPYLAFWLIPKAKRKPIFFNSTTTLTNPCANGEIAELKLPSFYWYVWNPWQKGVAQDHTSYNCKTLLTEGRDDLVVHAAFEKIPTNSTPIGFEKLFAERELRMKVIFGTVAYASESESVRKIKAAKDFLGSSDRFNSLLKKLPTYAELQGQDPALGAFLWFASRLEQIMDVDDLKIEDSTDHLIFRFQGALRASGKKTAVDVFWGPTDGFQKTAKHWPFLYSALQDSQLIFYIGHSGMGLNMSLAEMQERLGIPDAELRAALARQPYQLFGVVSCYSNSYYGDDYRQLRGQPGLVTDTLLVDLGSYRFPLPLGVLSYFDFAQAHRPVSLGRALSLFTGPQELVALRRQDSTQ